MERLFERLDGCKTAYHAVKAARELLLGEGFEELNEEDEWKIRTGGRYLVVRGGSALIAFAVGDARGFMIAASHCDSPCFKLKADPGMRTGPYARYNVERYGGGIFYSFLDTPLTVAGSVVLSDGKRVARETFTSSKNFVIPSVAIHFNRSVNDGIKLNAQTDMSPLASLGDGDGLKDELREFAAGREVMDSDLFLVSAQKPFAVGYEGELFSSPRIDNLTSVFASLDALCAVEPRCTDLCFVADNEEIGSRTSNGAASTFLCDVLRRICACTGEDTDAALADSMMLSCDNAHALHPNHPELSDPTNETPMGCGVVIKHHAMGNYATDSVASSLFKSMLSRSGVRHRDYYVRSDLPCGGTLGTISSSQVSVRSVDIGIPQLAMHSCVETASLLDYREMEKALTACFSHSLKASGGSVEID